MSTDSKVEKLPTGPIGAERTEIPVPPSLRIENQDAREMARVWVTEKGDLHAIIDSSIIDDVSIWGVVLTQLGQHVAEAYDGDAEEALAQIKAKLDEAWKG